MRQGMWIGWSQASRYGPLHLQSEGELQMTLLGFIILYVVCMTIAAALFGIAFKDPSPDEDDASMIVLGIVFAPLSLVVFAFIGFVLVLREIYKWGANK
jgi:hypothetical protein